jgi:SH3 domain protein
MEITMRSGKSTQYEILRLLPSGTKLTVLEVDNDAGYSLVRTTAGKEGWVLNRYLMTSPPAKDRLVAVERKLAEREAEFIQMKKSLSSTDKDKFEAIEERNRLNEQNSKLTRQLAEIRRTAANAIKIADENKSLKEKLATHERDVQLLQQENESLRDRSKRDWFIVGAIVVICSMLFGIMLTRIRWRKKSSWGDL